MGIYGLEFLEAANNLSTHDNFLTSHYDTSRAIQENEIVHVRQAGIELGSLAGWHEYHFWATYSLSQG